MSFFEVISYGVNSKKFLSPGHLTLHVMIMARFNLFPAGFFEKTFGKLFGINKYTNQIATFILLAKVIILLVLVMYAHKVLELHRNTTIIAAALVFLVFFTDIWIFGTIWAVALTIIAFLLIGLLGFIS